MSVVCLVAGKFCPAAEDESLRLCVKLIPRIIARVLFHHRACFVWDHACLIQQAQCA